jgi:ribosomal protein S18 acetylase RimI-like enzyme
MDLPPPTIGPPPEMPVADASVRAARTGDAAEMGAVQAAAWRASYAAVLPAATLDALDPTAVASIWRKAIAAPPSSRHSVLVALAAGAIVGFVATAPLDPPQEGIGEVAALVIHPEAQRDGHGSRLLNAAADRLRDNGFDHVVVWVTAGDEVRLHFLTAAGFQADGATRTLDLTGDGSAPLREHRLVASLARPA